MSTPPAFAYLAARDGGLVTLEHEGQRFVPLFARKVDFVAFGRRCREQLDGYGLRVVTNADETVAFLTALREAALQVGVSEQVQKPDAPETTFAILAPDVLIRTFEGPRAAKA